MSQSPIDIEASAPLEGVFPCQIVGVLDGKNERGQQRNLALTTMGVAAENPTAIVSPYGKVRPIRIVA